MESSAGKTSTTCQLDNVSLKHKRSIEINGNVSIMGCCSLYDGKMIFAVHTLNKLFVYDINGKFIQKISVGKGPSGMTVIDGNTIGVCCYDEKMVQIVCINEGTVKRNINVASRCRDIAYMKGKLYVRVQDRGIEIYSVEGEFIRSIPIDVPSNPGNVCCFRDGICYTSYSDSESECYIAFRDIDGKELWRSDVGNGGVTVDNYNSENIFVTNFKTDSLFVISADGNRSKLLLSRDDGLSQPQDVYFNKDNNTLLVVTSLHGKAAIYQLSTRPHSIGAPPSKKRKRKR